MTLVLLALACRYAPPKPDGTATDSSTDTAPVTDDTATAPPTLTTEDGLVYEVYLRSFQDSDGDGVGDLEGLRSRLGYLGQLGVTVLWLMPPFSSDTPSGYQVLDYLQVDEELGDDEQFEQVCAEAAALGIRVILDLPLNHTGAAHPWFVAAAADPEAADRERYLFSDTAWDDLRWFATERGDFYYAYFGDTQPDLDWSSDLVRGDMSATLDHWTALGTGGWRADAVRQLVEEGGVISDTEGSHEVMRWFWEQSRTRGDLVIAEAFYATETEPMLGWLGADSAPEADLVFDTVRANAYVTTMAEADPAALRTLVELEAAAGAEHRVVSYLSSHDTDRLPTRVPRAEKRRTLEVASFTLPGVPMLWYGEELDLPNGDPQYRNDQPQRTPMPWDTTHQAGFTTGTPWFNLAPGWETTNVATAEADPDSLLNLIRALSALRAASPALRSGAVEWVDTEHAEELRYTRTDGSEWITVSINTGTETLEPDVAGCRLTPEATVPAYGYGLWASEGLCDRLVPGPPEPPT